jgi:hypothetical protein
MVVRGAPPTDFVAKVRRPEHVWVVEEGARLTAALPALVRDYDPEPTTTEELWATGLGAAPQRVRHPRPEAAVALPVRRSARLRQRLE